MSFLRKKIRTFEPIDVKGGDITFGQRILLGALLSNSDKMSEHEVFKKVFDIMYDRIPDPRQYRACMGLFKEILEGINYWVALEARTLKYTPTQDEQRAGIEKYGEAVGDMGTVYSLAAKFSLDPDVVLSWKYGKVYGILLTDYEASKYQKRYHQVISKK